MCQFCVMRQQMAETSSAFTNGTHTATAAFTSSSASVNALLSGVSWSGSAGQSSIVPYSYAVSFEGGTLFNTAERTAAESALQQWENVANITFSPTSTPQAAQIAFSKTNLGPYIAGLTTTQFVGSFSSLAEVQVDSTITNFAVGGHGYFVLLHEIGHVLGLKHPGNYSGVEDPPFLSASEDSTDTTVMSYVDGSFTSATNYPVTPMIYDIAAAQFLYGANTAYNAGDTVYTLTGARTAQTIWDGGGTDLLDASTVTTDVTIDLKEGVSNVSHVGSGYYWMAFNAHIENVTGGTGNDALYGNGLGNVMNGGAGVDAVIGGQGNDTLGGNQGNDSLYGQVGNDLLRGGQDNDILYGGQNEDILAGDKGNDTLSGDRGNDELYGGQGSDILYGLSDNDTIYGDRDNDTLDGGGGNDVFVFNSVSGVDVISSFEGVGAAVGDLIRIQSGINGSDITSALQAVAHITYSSTSAVLDLGGGNLVTIAGVSAGLTVDDFLVV